MLVLLLHVGVSKDNIGCVTPACLIVSIVQSLLSRLKVLGNNNTCTSNVW